MIITLVLSQVSVSSLLMMAVGSSILSSTSTEAVLVQPFVLLVTVTTYVPLCVATISESEPKLLFHAKVTLVALAVIGLCGLSQFNLFGVESVTVGFTLSSVTEMFAEAELLPHWTVSIYFGLP